MKRSETRRPPQSRTTETVRAADERVPLEELGLPAREEMVLRMRYALPMAETEPLGRKTEDPQVLRHLAEIELRALKRMTSPPDDESPRDRLHARLRKGSA